MQQRLHLPAELDGNLWQYGNLASANTRHSHSELELNLVTRGLGTYLIGTRRYQIRRGDLLWLFPAQEHILIEQTPDFGMWIAVFKRTAIKRLATDTLARPLQQKNWPRETCRRLTQHDLSRFEELFAELTSTRTQPGLMNAGLAYVLLHAWQCFERAANVPVRDVHPAVERAIRLIRENSVPLSLDKLARQSGLSAPRLSRLFKEQTGFATVDFRNRQLVERFFAIYGTGQRQTMLNAALEAGFGSYPQFHRVFKRVTGNSPARYRRHETA